MQRKKSGLRFRPVRDTCIGHDVVSNSVESCSTGSLGQVQPDPSATFQTWPHFNLVSSSPSATLLATSVATFTIVFWSFFTCFLKGFWNQPNATSIWLWDHEKVLENRFLGTFKSHDSVENDFYFIFMKSFVFAKTGLENGRYRLQKGLKSEFSSLLDP